MILLPMVASADAVQIDGIYYVLNTEGNVAVVASNPNYYSGNVNIPEKVNYKRTEYSVTSIGGFAFENCSGLTSVTIPNSVTSIGEWTFYNCTGLTSVTIGNSVKSIGNYAFEGCSGLTSVYISDLAAWCNVAFSSSFNYAHHLFLNGKEIKDLVIPNSVTSIGWGAFRYCSGLTSVTIPNSVTSIGGSAFSGCSGLTSVTIPNSMTSIGNWAFNHCSGLTSITIPNSVTSIGNYAFRNCSGLTSITIGSGIKNIGFLAFASCAELTDVYCYAESVPSTESDAFEKSYIDYATLHVPVASIDAYKAAVPWSSFKTFMGLDGTNPETKKCATPTISFANGELEFICETEDVEFVSEVTVSDAKKNYSSKVSLTGVYKVSVYATRAGYENSDVVTEEFKLGDGGGGIGDVNGDGVIDVADVVAVVNIILKGGD